MDQLVAYERAQEAFARVLSAVAPDRLDAPTPCAGWTVRDLLDHVVGGNSRMGGRTPPAPADMAGYVEAVAASAEGAHDAFSAPEGLTRDYPFSIGPRPGTVAIGMRTTDLLAHAWDLARATGQSTDFDPELAAEVLAASRQRVTAELRGPGRPFAEERPCDPSRPAADQMAAFLGRDLDWQPS